MDRITIESGCQLQGSLICDNATVDQKAIVKDCIIGVAKHVEPEGKLLGLPAIIRHSFPYEFL